MFKKTLICISALLANVIVANYTAGIDESLVSWETKVVNGQVLSKKHYNTAQGQNIVSAAYWYNYAGHVYNWGNTNVNTGHLQFPNDIKNSIIANINSLKTLLNSSIRRIDSDHSSLVTEVKYYENYYNGNLGRNFNLREFFVKSNEVYNLVKYTVNCLNY
ncbi:hypothetical protein AYI70_g1329 [Smittium culicis]|uniref:Uncharacterized protein n=1 Tax=Smittium culicis TaxID=133412 RepID=A0A1R1YDN2_9FUNG|nr:hypothetical protein AYI70_g1329 [Smittium culicis]